jgi:hypothetical protein
MNDLTIQRQEMDFPEIDSLNRNQMAEVLKELFDEKKIEMIGDLSKDEIKLITRIYLIARLKGLHIWEDGANLYIKLLLSKNRESRKEIISAIAGISGKQKLMDRIKNVFAPNENG